MLDLNILLALLASGRQPPIYPFYSTAQHLSFFEFSVVNALGPAIETSLLQYENDLLGTMCQSFQINVSTGECFLKNSNRNI